MKNILCFMLSFMLVFNTTVVYADIHGGSVGSLDDPTKLYPALFDENGNFKPPAGQELFYHMIVGDKSGSASALAPILSVLSNFLDGYDNSNGQGISVETNSGGSTVHFHGSFIDELNTALQDSVHALDGYYLIEPKGKSPQEYVEIQKMKDSEATKLMNYLNNNNFQSILYDNFKNVCFTCPPNIYYYIVYNKYAYAGQYELHCYDKNHDSWDCKRYGYWVSGYNEFVLQQYSPPFQDSIDPESLATVLASAKYSYGLPVKLFYSKEALQNYFANNEKRTYVPQLPSGGFKVNIKYINNATNLPDITYNITTENKTETEIQNQYDTTVNNYLNNLNDFSDGGDGTITPTPTPSGGGSGGDFGDGTTPTPKPDFGDGSDLTDTNDWLKKIYEWLQSFGDTHSKFEKSITDYIEANYGKLDQIIEAINALSDGKTEDEKNGCKYDFTALSDFMTKLWNESDKKFDKMVELLEENNKYQKKLVNSLNEIKAILVTQTIMDVFQDRSQQTAEKAKDKFPTSLPWDIALVVNAMSAEPEKPQFNLPIQIKSLNINEEIHVDLASGEWEKLAKTCRYLLSILFILLMIQLSRNLFFNGGDD